MPITARRSTLTLLLRTTALAAVLAPVLFITGCVHRSGGTWMVDSAPRPEGWPELTPIGEVRVQEYPAYRAASVSESDLNRSGMRPLFMSLFDHIKTNDIAMSAPVDMGYTRADQPRMQRMAFVYRDQSIGSTGEDGPVTVEDLPPTTFASVGVRGRYTTANYKKGLAILDQYFENQSHWRAAGEPRYLGYNGPLTLWFLRYGEVQIPVEQTETTATDQ